MEINRLFTDPGPACSPWQPTHRAWHPPFIIRMQYFLTLILYSVSSSEYHFLCFDVLHIESNNRLYGISLQRTSRLFNPWAFTQSSVSIRWMHKKRFWVRLFVSRLFKCVFFCLKLLKLGHLFAIWSQRIWNNRRKIMEKQQSNEN